ncbi:MAG: hypothetical protein LBT34_02080 [Clostridiales Family XIII bacterium]|jgi:putative membrane fusion protein|nr:hypothetical protein [Clostridiales Family XIII bacterium]
MKKKNKIAVFLFVFSLVGLYVVIYVIPGVTDSLRRTTVLEFGHLPVSDTVTGWIVRDETVYLADRSGNTAYYVGEGVKVRKGVKILDIAGTGEAPETSESALSLLTERVGGAGAFMAENTAPESCVVSYFADGYETLFSPDNMRTITKKQAEALEGNVERLARESVLRGEPVCKLVDNSIWRMLFWLSKDSGSVVKYEAGKTVAAVLPKGEVSGKVSAVLDQGEDWLVVLDFDRYYEDLAQIRSVEATIVAADYQGLLVENKNLASENGRLGVYARQKSGEFEFVPVKVHASDGEWSVISVSSFTDADGKQVKTVNIYEEILKDPGAHYQEKK